MGMNDMCQHHRWSLARCRPGFGNSWPC